MSSYDLKLNKSKPPATAKIKNNNAIIDNIEEWWSTKGVPDEGYAITEINKAYKKQ